MNVSPPSNRIVTSFPSADTSMVCARFQSSLCCMWTRCWVVIIACAKSIFVADAIVLLLPGSWHQPEFESAGWWQKLTRRAWCKQYARCGIVKEFDKDFHKMQLGRGGECLACKGVSQTTNQNPQQPLIGMIFTNADPRYAGRLDDKQGGDTILTMERVRY